jgi:hypothetical protein
MPSSRPNAIPTVVHLIRQLKPESILDVGIGFGKWGHLFREYTDINEAERDPARYERRNWRVRIDGIEGYAGYVTEMHRFLYNNIHIGGALELIEALPGYDVIFMGDVIEHFTKADGLAFLRKAAAKAAKAVIITTPKEEIEQEDLCGNELERHRSSWTHEDFAEFDGAIVKNLDDSILIAVLPRRGVPPPDCEPPPPPDAGQARLLRLTRKELTELIPATEPFILVDDEQMRSELPHVRIFPFLEREGIYWGRPADDEEAIRELERLRRCGAKRIVFIQSTFWWLDHYRTFAEHLRGNFSRKIESDQLILFEIG